MRRRSTASEGIVYRFVWPLKRFDKAFMNSDTLGNYSRYYSWSANQLGHLTLGLATAFLFVWLGDHLAQSLFVTARLLASADDVAGMIQNIEWIDFLLATLFFGTTVAAIIVIGYRMALRIVNFRDAAFTPAVGAARQRHGEDDGPPSGARLALFVGSRVLLLLTLIGGVVGIIWLVAEARASTVTIFQQRIFSATATATIALAFASVAALQSRSPWMTALSWVAIVTACFLYSDETLNAVVEIPEVAEALQAGADGWAAPLAGLLSGDADGDRLHPILFVYLAALFVFFAVMVALVEFRRPAPRIAIGVGTVLFLYALYTAAPGAEDPFAWRLAVAAAIASLAVWWVKEFGNDLKRVTMDLNVAKQLRKKRGYPDERRGVLRQDDFAEVIDEYHGDALADAFTDSLFYLVGALIAAGALSAGLEAGVTGANPTTVAERLAAEDWRNLIATLALLGFLALFVWAGFSWMRRNDAIDEAAVIRANRFAMIDFAVDLRVYRDARELGDIVDQRARDGRSSVAGTMQGLRAFCCGELGVRDPADQTLTAGSVDVNHLVIAGRFGSGRTKLGAAIASEAALCNLPPFGRFRVFGAARPRIVRFMSLRNILDRGAFSAEQLLASRNKIDLHVMNEADPFSSQLLDAIEEDSASDAPALSLGSDEQAEVREAAQSWRAPSDEERRRRSRLRRALMRATMQRLDLEVIDQTVWIINAPVDRPEKDGGATWTPALPDPVREYLDDLIAALTEHCCERETGHNPAVAVALSARPLGDMIAE